MRKCPISYHPCEKLYSSEGLKMLSKTLTKLEIFPYTADEQRKEAFFNSSNLSIQGIHPKLSCNLVVNKLGIGEFVITEKGNFILKPQSDQYFELPQNENVTMKLAGIAGIEVPLHGLLYCKGGTFTYFIKRFDRLAKNQKLEVEDFSSLAGKTRETKYDFTMEGLEEIISKHCTFPMLEKYKLLKISLFNFIIGNEDMHLKNFSVISRNNKIELSPAYDLVNSTIATVNAPAYQLALSLNGKRSNMGHDDFMGHFAKDILKLSEKSINQLIKEIKTANSDWEKVIEMSFLSDMMKQKYFKLISQRLAILKF